MPIFVEGRLVGWASMFGHMTDVGGKTPGSMPTDARTIYEEGVVIPPFKLYTAGQLNEDALRIILNQVRVPDWNRADLNGLVAACRTASPPGPGDVRPVRHRDLPVRAGRPAATATTGP